MNMSFTSSWTCSCLLSRSKKGFLGPCRLSLKSRATSRLRKSRRSSSFFTRPIDFLVVGTLPPFDVASCQEPNKNIPKASSPYRSPPLPDLVGHDLDPSRFPRQIVCLLLFSTQHLLIKLHLRQFNHLLCVSSDSLFASAFSDVFMCCTVSSTCSEN